MAVILTVTQSTKSICDQFNDLVRYRPHTKPAHLRDGLHRPIRGSYLRVPPLPTTESPADISPTYSTPLPTPSPRGLSSTYNLLTGLKCLIGTTIHRKPHQSQPLRPSPSGIAWYITSHPGSRGSQEPFADIGTKGMTASETRSQLYPLNNRVLNLLIRRPPGGASAPPSPPAHGGALGSPRARSRARARARARTRARECAHAHRALPGPGTPNGRAFLMARIKGWPFPV